ncbi:MAG: RNA polymerase subunit sigma [Planctomycetes bacterium]|nr:RNA polymerase subunit sigma [Planctomycetota bacterium]
MSESLEQSGSGARGSLFADTVYQNLRAMAQRKMADEKAGHTLSATALVHEVFLKMKPRIAGSPVDSSSNVDSEHRAFFFAAGEAMRQILIDHARARGAAKRGGGLRREIENVEMLAAEGDSQDVMALDGAFARLEAEDARAADVVRLRFYAGLSVDEAAAVLGVSRRSVLRDWEYARAFLKVELESEQ